MRQITSLILVISGFLLFWGAIRKKKRSINLTQLGYPYAKKYIIILPIIRKTVSIYKKSQQWKKWQWKFFLLLHNQIFQNINNYSNKKKDEKAYLQKVEIIIPRWHALHILQIAGLTDIMFTYVLIIRLLKQKIGLLIEINHPKKKTTLQKLNTIFIAFFNWPCSWNTFSGPQNPCMCAPKTTTIQKLITHKSLQFKYENTELKMHNDV